MIDTIVLLLDQDAFSTTLSYWRKKPTKKDLISGIYKPRLSLGTKRGLGEGRKKVLKIEFSIPKLLFGNNLEELRYKDRFQIFQKLVIVLKKMGVTTTQDAIAHAPVVAVHYSKNISFADGATPYHFINKIRQANITHSLDVNQTDYRNFGHSYKWHCNSYEVAFYDKIKDLQKAKISGKRSVEKACETQSIGDITRRWNHSTRGRGKHGRKKFEVLRMEVRLNKRQKIKQLFKKLNIKASLIFKKLFKPAISKKILLHYIDELESRRPTLLDYKMTSDKALLADLIFNNPSLGPKRILQIYGLKHAIDAINIGERRQMFSAYSDRSWCRLIADLNKIKLHTRAAASPFVVIKKNLMKFKPLKLR